MTEKITLANDLGNGSMKLGFNNDDWTVIPSIYADQRQQDMIAPVSFDNQQQQDVYINDMFKHMNVSVQSPNISTTNRMFVGQSAADSNLLLHSFDVNDFAGKSTTDLAMILTLSTIGAKAIKQNYLENNHQLGTDIDVNVTMTTALPIAEGKKPNVVDNYRDRYMNVDHMVTFHNFNQLVNVKIHFDLVTVALEGETAQYAIRKPITELANGIEQDFSAHYPELAKAMNGAPIYEVSDTLGIDIGEGTTDLAVFSNGQLNALASSSLNSGYGNVLEEAMADLLHNGYNMGSRLELQQLLSSEDNPLRRGKKAMALNAVNAQLDQMTDRIVHEISGVLRQVSNKVDVIYVYGGGSIPMEPVLRPALMNKIKAFVGDIDIPVVFIPAGYAQYLNDLGLNMILQAVLATQQPKKNVMTNAPVEPQPAEQQLDPSNIFGGVQ